MDGDRALVAVHGEQHAVGVVVDVGAQMSHAAIVSRELGIPAVVSVAGASTTIPDGVLLTVDGDEGTVTVHG